MHHNYSLFVLVALSSLIKVSMSERAAQFLVEPQDQRILLKEMAFFYCNAVADELRWILDGVLLQILHDRNIPDISWDLQEDRAKGEKNLSMTINGTLERNNTRIKCRATGEDTYIIDSYTATLYIYEPPVPPNVSITILNSSVIAHFQSPYCWSDFEMSWYMITVTNQTETIVTANISATTSYINVSNKLVQFSPCVEYTVSVMSVSPLLGNSTPYSFSLMSPYSKPLQWSSITGEVYYDANLQPIVVVSAKVSDLCPLLTYTYSVIATSQNQSAIEFDSRQLFIDGSITEELKMGLDVDTKYTFWIEVRSTHPLIAEAEITLSPQNTFITGTNLSAKIRQKSCELTSNNDNLQLVSILLGVFCVLLLLLLLIFLICCLLWRADCSRKKKCTTTSPQPMITNPIYSGPLYETVPQGYNQLSSSASTTPDSSPTTPLNGDTIHYSINPTSRTDILDLVRINTDSNQQSGRVVSPLAGNSYRSSSISSNSMVRPHTRKGSRSASISGNLTFKRPHRERNKLHLTLSLGNKGNDSEQSNTIKESALKKQGAGSVGAIAAEDENYTIMSPAGSLAFSSSPIGEWGELSPELTSKYQEEQ